MIIYINLSYTNIDDKISNKIKKYICITFSNPCMLNQMSRTYFDFRIFTFFAIK